MDYDILEIVFTRSELVCDPLEWKRRQYKLLKALAEYIIERDKPEEQEEEEEDEYDE